jgi:DNA-binding response OmpR family regulator
MFSHRPFDLLLSFDVILQAKAEMALKIESSKYVFFEKNVFSFISEKYDNIKEEKVLRRKQMKILIIEDERLLADSLKIMLEKKGFDVEAVYDGCSGKDYAEQGCYDLLILDVMLPGMDGFKVAKDIRAKHLGTPILMLTAKSDVDDRVEGLNSGADYYLAKPFETRELLACINSLLRRQGAQVDVVSLGNTSLDLGSAILSCGDKSIRLSAKEFDIMRHLLAAGQRNISKEALLVRVWGFDSEAVENHVEVYIGFLRKKLTAIGSNIRIEAVRRLGYHLEVDIDDK